jgi:hypothetical protein
VSCWKAWEVRRQCDSPWKPRMSNRLHHKRPLVMPRCSFLKVTGGPSSSAASTQLALGDYRVCGPHSRR